MITRSNLAEQLREYQIRSKNDWTSFSFFSSTANIPSRTDVVIFVVLELWTVALLIFSGISFYLGYAGLALLFISAAALAFAAIRVVKRLRHNRKSKRRMLLPLSM